MFGSFLLRHNASCSAAKVINSVVAPDAGVMLKSDHQSKCVPLTLACTQPYPQPQPVVLKAALPDSMFTLTLTALCVKKRKKSRVQEELLVLLFSFSK